MAASFPNAKKTFSQVVNGVTKLVAALFNAAYDEIEAIETYFGATGGGAQSYSESIKGLLGSYRRGCAVEYKGAADLYVRAGEIAILDASGNLRLRRNTSDLTIDWGDIDTGAEAAATTYYVYAVADAQATTFTVVISANATTPTGCTFYKLLGSFYNNSSGDIDAASFINTVSPSALSQMKKYDSGWFSVTTSTEYTLTHNLGTTKILVSLYGATAADGTNMGEIHASTGTGQYDSIYGITTTQLKISLGGNDSIMTAATTRTHPSYVRIIAVALE